MTKSKQDVDLSKLFVIVNSQGEVLRCHGGMLGGYTFNSKKKHIAIFPSKHDANVELRLLKNVEGVHTISLTEYKHIHENEDRLK